MSLAFAKEVMQMKLDPDNKHFPKVLATKQAIASSMLTATARIRADTLRPAQDDGMDQVLEELRREAGDPPPAEEDYDPFS